MDVTSWVDVILRKVIATILEWAFRFGNSTDWWNLVASFF